MQISADEHRWQAYEGYIAGTDVVHIGVSGCR